MIIWSSDESEIEKFELGKVVKIMENVKDKAGSMDELKELAAKAGAMENKPMREKRDIDLSTPADFTPPEDLYKELIKKILTYHPSTDISMIEKAYKVASKAHEGQLRKSGEPYIMHPLCVAIILAELELDKETIVAGILHDVVEDTVMTSEEIAAEFSEEVAFLVEGVTKLTQLKMTTDKIEVQAENLRKDRKMRAEEKALKAPVTMLIPMVLFIFPVIFIVLLGPAVLNIMDIFG